MQNPFKNRDQDDYRRDRDDNRFESRDRHFDETRSFNNGDGGRSAEAWRNQGRDYGRDESRSNYDRDWGYGQQRPSNWRADRSEYDTGYGQYTRDDASYRSTSQWNPGSSSQGRGYDAENWRSDQGRRDFQPDYRASSTQGERYQNREGYAPGSQIWRDDDQHTGPSYGGARFGGQSQNWNRPDHEPDYLHWRNQQVADFDRDYDDWRSERRQKFSSDFDTWRQSRPRTEASNAKTPGDNPIVSDIADGGNGSKKS